MQLTIHSNYLEMCQYKICLERTFAKCQMELSNVKTKHYSIPDNIAIVLQEVQKVDVQSRKLFR